MSTSTEGCPVLEKIRPIKEYLLPITDEFVSRGKAPKIPITTLKQLNSKLWGLKEGELVIVGARTSQGKSALVAQIALDVAMNSEFPVLFLSLEMNVESIIERMFCNVMSIDNYELLTGKYNTNSEIQKAWGKFCNQIDRVKLMVTNGIGYSFDEIIKVVEVMTPTPKVVIVDYIQAIRTSANTSREQTNEYIRMFRQLAIEKKFCGILCSQVNRGASQNSGNEPNMAQLKNTGVLEEHSDKVLLLHWANHYDEGCPQSEYKVILSKNRNGRTGELKLYFEPQYYRFSDAQLSHT